MFDDTVASSASRGGTVTGGKHPHKTIAPELEPFMWPSHLKRGTKQKEKDPPVTVKSSAAIVF